jgi:hypothetical protein
MSAKVGNGLVKIDVSKNWDALTPDIVAQNEKDYWQLVYLNVNNQKIPALQGRLGGQNVIKVGKTDFAKIQAAGKTSGMSDLLQRYNSQGQPTDKDGNVTKYELDKSNPPLRTGPPDMSNFKKLEESPELTAMLRIAGLR